MTVRPTRQDVWRVKLSGPMVECRRLLFVKYDWCYNYEESNNCLSYFDIKYNHLKRFLICGPASCPHLLPFLWAFQSPMAGMCPGSLLCSGVWWPSGLFSPPAAKPASLSVRSPQRLLASAVAVHSIPCVTLATQGASHNIQSLVFCDTDNNQQHHGEV